LEKKDARYEMILRLYRRSPIDLLLPSKVHELAPVRMMNYLLELMGLEGTAAEPLIKEALKYSKWNLQPAKESVITALVRPTTISNTISNVLSSVISNTISITISS
jgi:hypothetical protein